jgi:hypothetical protein
VTFVDRVLEYVQRSGVVGARAADVAVTLRVTEDHAATMLSKLARRKKIARASRGLYVAKPAAHITHRPSRLDAEHTACGERLGPTVHLRLGDGETCERCTHVVAQVAAAVRGEPSWAQKHCERVSVSRATHSTDASKRRGTDPSVAKLARRMGSARDRKTGRTDGGRIDT